MGWVLLLQGTHLQGFVKYTLTHEVSIHTILQSDNKWKKIMFTGEGRCQEEHFTPFKNSHRV
jgi:hypothetical protein